MSHSLENKKVLIVEDDKDFLWILKQSFTNQGVKVVYAQDGQEGFTMAEKEKPDLIIIDVMLPKMNGIQMAKQIRERGIKSQIIFLTNSNNANYISEAIEAISGADYIIKADVSIDQIVARVKEKLIPPFS